DLRNIFLPTVSFRLKHVHNRMFSVRDIYVARGPIADAARFIDSDTRPRNTFKAFKSAARSVRPLPHTLHVSRSAKHSHNTLRSFAGDDFIPRCIHLRFAGRMA